MSTKTLGQTVPRLQKRVDELMAERNELIVAHDTQVTIAKQFQKLFREIEPEMTRLENRVAELEAALKSILECVEDNKTNWGELRERRKAARQAISPKDVD